jgi:hypothetical protein
MANKTINDSPITQLTFRKYEKPEGLSKRETVKKLCLSIGLLQPGDSRDIIVDIFYILLEYKNKNRLLGSEEIKEKVIKIRKEEGLELKGIASSNIRRQLKRLRDLFFVEKIKNKYRISEFGNIQEIFQEKIIQFVLPNTINRIKDYMESVDHKFR